MSTEISNTDDILDSREVIARIEELTDLGTHYDGGEDPLFNIRLLDADERHEYTALTALAEQGENFADWDSGVTLIRDSYFTAYARELLVDIGYIPKGFPEWIVVNWDETADNIQSDYSDVDFDGETYWVR